MRSWKSRQVKGITAGDRGSKRQIQDQSQAYLTPNLCLVYPPAQLEAGTGSEEREVMRIPLSNGRVGSQGEWEERKWAGSQIHRTLETIVKTLDFCLDMMGGCQRILSKRAI